MPAAKGSARTPLGSIIPSKAFLECATRASKRNGEICELLKKSGPSEVRATSGANLGRPLFLVFFSSFLLVTAVVKTQ
jgi:hypothetical protein